MIMTYMHKAFTWLTCKLIPGIPLLTITFSLFFIQETLRIILTKERLPADGFFYNKGKATRGWFLLNRMLYRLLKNYCVNLKRLLYEKTYLTIVFTKGSGKSPFCPLK